MYGTRSFQLTKNEFDYVLPVYYSSLTLRKKLYQSSDRYYFIGDSDDLEDLLYRLKGVYENDDDGLKNMVSYHCFVERSLNPFRESMGVMLLYHRA